MRKVMNFKKLQHQSQLWMLTGVALATLGMTGLVSHADDGTATTTSESTVTATTASQPTAQTATDQNSDQTATDQDATKADDDSTYDANVKTGVSEKDGTKTTTYDDGTTSEEITDKINLAPRPKSQKQTTKVATTTGTKTTGTKTTATTQKVATTNGKATVAKTNQPTTTVKSGTTSTATVATKAAQPATVKQTVTPAVKSAHVVATSAVKTAKTTTPVTFKTTTIAKTDTALEAVNLKLVTKPAITLAGNGTPTTTPISMAGGLLLALTTLTGVAGVSRKLRQV